MNLNPKRIKIVGIVNPSTKLGNNFITYNSASIYDKVRETYPRKKFLRSYLAESWLKGALRAVMELEFI
jgi:hypothetical protein